MSGKTDDYYLNKTEPNKSCLLALRSILLEIDENVTETIKWGMPCFCYKGKMFGFLWVDKKSKNPYLLLVEGKYLDNPKLKKGDRSRMKQFLVNPNIDLPIQEITTVLNQALDLYRNGVIKIK
jgi:hypothetical protein